MKKNQRRFTILIPVKPYVKRFLEINYGQPVDFNPDQFSHKFLQELLRKPNSRFDNKYPDDICSYSEETEVYITEDDFYRYGWELTKTNIVVFGKRFEGRAKALMRSFVGIYSGLGLPIFKSIDKFQSRFEFDEDVWRYEAIKKDFYRHGVKQKIDFDNEIFHKIEKIILVNLYDSGTVSQQAVKQYENDK